MTDEELNEFFEKISPLNEEDYMNIDLDRLVLYGVNVLEENHIEPTYEKTVVVVFKLFPKRFSLVGFSNYPDGKKVHDCLWHCYYKTKMWLSGNVKSGFHLTKKGEYFLEETKKLITGEKKKKNYISKPVSRKEMFFISKLKKSNAFRKFLENYKSNISEDEIREVLISTKQTSKETLFHNLELLINYAESLQEKDVLDFLNFLKSKVGELK